MLWLKKFFFVPLLSLSLFLLIWQNDQTLAILIYLHKSSGVKPYLGLDDFFVTMNDMDIIEMMSYLHLFLSISLLSCLVYFLLFSSLFVFIFDRQYSWKRSERISQKKITKIWFYGQSELSDRALSYWITLKRASKALTITFCNIFHYIEMFS